jgi:hypothetical protein
MKQAIALALAFALPAAPASAQDRTAQARNNYDAILNGRIQLSQLTRQEQTDVIELNRRIRAARGDDLPPSQRCIHREIEREGGSVTTLERRIIEMKCREAGD